MDERFGVNGARVRVKRVLFRLVSVSGLIRLGLGLVFGKGQHLTVLLADRNMNGKSGLTVNFP